MRAAVGPELDIMVDANQSMTAAEAIRRARLLEPSDLYWFEEPMPADDVAGHAALAAAVTTSRSRSASRCTRSASSPTTCTRGAAGIVQVDVARIGGITPWLKVAHLAEAHNVVGLPTLPDGTARQPVLCGPNSRYLEHIPQLRAITQARDRDRRRRRARAHRRPVSGIDWDRDAIDDRRVQ